MDFVALVHDIKEWGREEGFASVSIAALDMADAAPGLQAWLDAGMHGDMSYMQRHAHLRVDPSRLVPGAVRAVCARLDYLAPDSRDATSVLDDRSIAYVARYALGRDYHKVVRSRLARLARRIESAAGSSGYRVFSDSAPVLEVELATRSGLGWRGKNTLLLTRDRGSLFFLGEIYTDLPLPVDPPTTAHCGDCSACIEACPTGAIVAPYRLDARRCISYLTIEHHGPIPLELRPLLGNRVYGCDDCQLVCPWNRVARPSTLPDFAVRHGLDAAQLIDLFAWSAEEFGSRMAGSPIHRIGYERWSRNLAVGLGNAPRSPRAVEALRARSDDPSPLVREHVAWALAQQQGSRA